MIKRVPIMKHEKRTFLPPSLRSLRSRRYPMKERLVREVLFALEDGVDCGEERVGKTKEREAARDERSEQRKREDEDPELKAKMLAGRKREKWDMDSDERSGSEVGSC